MAINCGLGWQRKALVEALGRPDEDELQPDSSSPGIKLHILRWRCDDGGLVSAVKAMHQSSYEIEAACNHRAHHDLARLPEIRVADVALVDAAGNALEHAPCDLEGVRLRFKLNSPVRAYARVEVDPDQGAPGMLPRRRIEVDGETFGPGTGVFDLRLTAVDELDEPLRYDLEVSIHVVDPKTAVRDRNTDGVCLWNRDYRVQPVRAGN